MRHETKFDWAPSQSMGALAGVAPCLLGRVRLEPSARHRRSETGRKSDPKSSGSERRDLIAGSDLEWVAERELVTPVVQKIADVEQQRHAPVRPSKARGGV